MEVAMEVWMPLLKACGPYLLMLVAIMVGFMVYFYAPYWKVRKIPGPPATFLVGHLPLLAKYGPDVMRVLSKNYGPIFRFHMGRQPLVMVADPELCREVGIRKFKEMKNRSIRSPTSGSPLHEQGLFLTRDSRWSSMRNTIISLYQPSHLASLVPTMQSHVDSLFANVAAAEEDEVDVPFSELSLRLAIDVIGQTAFGVDFGLSKGGSLEKPIISAIADDSDDDVSAFVKQHMRSIGALKMDLSSSLSTVVGIVAPVLQTPCREILKRIPGTADYRMLRTNEKLVERIDAIIAKRESERTSESKDFLAAVLNARESGAIGKELFTHSYVRALAYEHLLAGTKTTSFTLAMAVYLVSMHPEVEEKLLREIDDAEDVSPTAEDLQLKFSYLDQVVKETMRYLTVSPLVARETSQQVEIGGYVIPKGTWVWLALGVLAKDPKQFPEPDVFRPERFDPNCEEEKRRHPYAHIPFGIGPRACIGQKFALQEIKLALLRLYRTYVFEHSPKMESPLELEYGLVLGFKHGIKLRAVKRRP